MRKKENKKISGKPALKWFYLVIVLIPIIFFLLLETGLRIFNYGEDYNVFIQMPDYPDRLYLNPDLSKKYFSNLKKGPRVGKAICVLYSFHLPASF